MAFVRKVIVTTREIDGARRLTPLIQFYIENAPHRRMAIEIIGEYREVLRRALLAADVMLPISQPIDVDLTFINPTSTDLGNLYLAFEQAMDKYTPRGRNIGILADDSLIQTVGMRKMDVNPREEGARSIPAPAARERLKALVA